METYQSTHTAYASPYASAAYDVMECAIPGKARSSFLSHVTNGMDNFLARATNSQSYAEHPEFMDSSSTDIASIEYCLCPRSS